MAALAASCLCVSAAWSQATMPDRQTIRYFKMPLEKEVTREVEMVSITVPPGAGNEFHRHYGDQWCAVQEGEVTFTIKGQPPVVLKAGESNHIARGIVHRQQNLSDKPVRYIVLNIFDTGKPTAEPVPEN
jgi:quercetin dioxygenase-like cupin family protein